MFFYTIRYEPMRKIERTNMNPGSRIPVPIISPAPPIPYACDNKPAAIR
jgi:hypothetical protein